jgi:hypothetical protein
LGKTNHTSDWHAATVLTYLEEKQISGKLRLAYYHCLIIRFGRKLQEDWQWRTQYLPASQIVTCQQDSLYLSASK